MLSKGWPFPWRCSARLKTLSLYFPTASRSLVLPFDFSSSLLLSLWDIKESGIQTQIRWLFWGTSLLFSWSDGFLNTVVFLASTPSLSNSLVCPVASTVSLDLVTDLCVYKIYNSEYKSKKKNPSKLVIQNLHQSYVSSRLR